MQKIGVFFILFILVNNAYSSAQLEFGPVHYPWAEEISSPQVDAFTSKENQISLQRLEKVAGFKDIQNVIQKEILANQEEARNKASIIGDYAYNFLVDDEHIQGLYRRTAKDEYLKAKESGDYSQLVWESTVDLDKFLKEHTFPNAVTEPSSGSWSCYYDEDSKNLKRCLVGVSQSGGDRNIYYEYDFEKNQWVTESSFNFEILGRSSMAWVDEDTMIVHLDGMSYHNHLHADEQIKMEEAVEKGLLTYAGYPNRAFLWKRGQAFNLDKLVYQANESASWLSVSSHKDKKSDPVDKMFFIYEGIENNDYKTFIKYDGNNDGIYATQELKLPVKKQFFALTTGLELILKIEEEWLGFKPEDIVSVKINLTERSSNLVEPKLIYRNTDADLIISSSHFIDGEEYNPTDDRIIVKGSKNVSDELLMLSRNGNDWQKSIVSDPLNLKYKTMSVFYDKAMKQTKLTVRNFVTPTHTYELVTKDGKLVAKLLEKDQEKFDAKNIVINQLWVDMGLDQNNKKIRVPYYIIYDKTKVQVKNNPKPAPTLMWAYGGFSVGYSPFYLGNNLGNLWLKKGGVYVLPAIRGGDEFGSYWHLSALKENRKNTYDDFFAISEDLINRGITSPEKLGIQGGSNGGLLMGIAFTKRPELYNAIVSEVPLLDMSRYHKLLVGASWMDEYGDPEGDEEEFWQDYSPLHNVVAGKDYPPIFIKTNRYDDRVHPAHARKLAIRLNELNLDHYYFEDSRGGHGGDAMSSEERAYRAALVYAYLYMQLM